MQRCPSKCSVQQDVPKMTLQPYKKLAGDLLRPYICFALARAALRCGSGCHSGKRADDKVCASLSSESTGNLSTPATSRITDVPNMYWPQQPRHAGILGGGCLPMGRVGLEESLTNPSLSGSPQERPIQKKTRLPRMDARVIVLLGDALELCHSGALPSVAAPPRCCGKHYTDRAVYCWRDSAGQPMSCGSSLIWMSHPRHLELNSSDMLLPEISVPLFQLGGGSCQRACPRAPWSHRRTTHPTAALAPSAQPAARRQGPRGPVLPRWAGVTTVGRCYHGGPVLPRWAGVTT
eukprot:gene10483-biopygen1766